MLLGGQADDEAAVSISDQHSPRANELDVDRLVRTAPWGPTTQQELRVADSVPPWPEAAVATEQLTTRLRHGVPGETRSSHGGHDGTPVCRDRGALALR